MQKKHFVRAAFTRQPIRPITGLVSGLFGADPQYPAQGLRRGAPGFPSALSCDRTPHRFALAGRGKRAGERRRMVAGRRVSPQMLARLVAKQIPR